MQKIIAFSTAGLDLVSLGISSFRLWKMPGAQEIVEALMISDITLMVDVLVFGVSGVFLFLNYFIPRELYHVSKAPRNIA